MRPVLWDAYEFPPQEHSSDWFWIVGAVAFGIAALSVIVFENVLFAVLVAVGAIALSFQALKKPRLVSYGIDDAGVHVGPLLYPYDTLIAFAFDDDHLMLKSKRGFVPLLAIPLPDDAERRDAIHAALAGRLPLEELHRSLPEKIFERLGF